MRLVHVLDGMDLRPICELKSILEVVLNSLLEVLAQKQSSLGGDREVESSTGQYVVGLLYMSTFYASHFELLPYIFPLTFYSVKV